ELGLRERQRGQELIAQLLRGNGPGQRDSFGIPIAFVCHEEEQLVLDDWASQGSAELIETGRRLRLRSWKKRIAREKRLVLIVLDRRTMELVGAGAAKDINLSADNPSVFCGQNALDHLDLSHSVDTHDADLVLAAVLVNSSGFWIGNRI